jgi:hypothetical protein
MFGNNANNKEEIYLEFNRKPILSAIPSQIDLKAFIFAQYE